MKLSRSAWLLLAGPLWAGAADSIPAELFPPKTDIVVSLSLRALLDSPVLKTLGSENLIHSANLGSAIALSGIDVFKDVDTVVLAGSTQGQNRPGLVILRGRFSPQRAKGRNMYHDVPLFFDSKDDQETLAILDGENAIIGTTDDVKAAIDRRGSASALSPELAQRIADLGGQYDFWGVGRIPNGLPPAAAPVKNLQFISSFEFAAMLRQGLRFSGEMHMRTPQDAAQIESVFQAIEAMTHAGTAAGTRFDLHADRERVAVELNVTETDLKQAMGGQSNSLASLISEIIGARMAMTQGKAIPATPPPHVTRAESPRGAKSPGRITNNERGETVHVTLPN